MGSEKIYCCPRRDGVFSDCYMTDEGRCPKNGLNCCADKVIDEDDYLYGD
jgi:hypothetical protein